MTMRRRYVTRARRIYCGTVFTAGLVGFGVGQWHDGVAAIAVSVAVVLTLPLSLYGYFAMASAWSVVADALWTGRRSSYASSASHSSPPASRSWR